MTRPNKLAIIALFMALAIGSQTMVSRPINFITMFISPKTAQAQEAAAPQGSQGANKIEYKSEGLKDPFQEEKIEIKEEPKKEAQAKPLPALQIQGIVWGGSLPQAIINNKVVRAGDTIEGVQITDIKKSVVTVFFGNQQYNLSTSSQVSSRGPKKSPNPYP